MSTNDTELAASEKELERQEQRHRFEEQERQEQEDRHRGEYPLKLDARDRFYPGGSSASELVERALADGLDPDTHWTYEDIVNPSSMSAPDDYEYTWPRWNTPLHLALLCFDYQSVGVILRHGGDPNIRNKEGRTPLHEAIKLQRLEGVRYLIRNGADPNGVSLNNLVPLHAALYEGNEEIFFALLEEGATLEASAYCEWSIADLALLASEKSILGRLMSEYGILPTPLVQSPTESTHQTPRNVAMSARRLLAVVSSNQVLPDKASYEVYHHLLSGLDFPQHQRWDAATVNDLVDNVMESLYSATERPRLALDEVFCSECLKFQAFIETHPRDRAAANWDAYFKPFDLHESKQELDVCALTGCPICRTMSEMLTLRLNEEGVRSEDMEISPIRLKLWAQSELNSRDSHEPRRIERITAQVGDSNTYGHLPRFTSFRLQTYDTGFEFNQTYHGQEHSAVHDTSTGSQKAISVAKQWLHTCKTSPKHSICRDTYSSSESCGTLPTRVLYVGSGDEEPFLFESNGLKKRYCILSYCWGRSGNATTRKSNFLDRTKRIPLASLPTLLRQAVLATRALGYEYLWIDALCIIQDDPNDWAREATVMHDLYSRADLTITSLLAADCSDNLFESRLRQAARPIPLKVSLPKRYRHPFVEDGVFEFAAYPFRNRLGKSHMIGPVHQRAWTLQEQLMSTRVVYFGRGILHWECLCSYQVEPDPEGMVIHYDYEEWKSRRKTKLAAKALQGGAPQQKNASPIEVWQSQVEEFTRRKITKQSDRIPAFLAISKALCEAGGDEFRGGLWTGKHLIRSMCWELERPDETDMRGPSWTWGSRSGKISYELVEHPGNMMPKAYTITVDITTDMSHSKVEGSITLKGFLGVCRSDSDHPHPDSRSSRECGISEWFDHTSESRDNLYIFDMLESGKTPSPRPWSGGQQLTVCSLYATRGRQYLSVNAQKSIVSLLLKSVDAGKEFGTASVFRRVGIAQKVAFERDHVPDEAGYDTIARYRGVTEFETDRVVVII